MFNRIKTLMLLQLSDRFKIKKVDNVPKLLAKIGLALLGMVIVSAICMVLFFLLKDVVMLSTPKIITFAIVFLQFLSIIACKNSQKGKRCFIIAPGPSLTKQDVNKLKGEYTFAVNSVFKIFKYHCLYKWVIPYSLYK